MSLETILATKGSEVVSIDFTTDLAAAAKLLTKHRIGALGGPRRRRAPRRCSVGARHRYALLRKANAFTLDALLKSETVDFGIFRVPLSGATYFPRKPITRPHAGLIWSILGQLFPELAP